MKKVKKQSEMRQIFNYPVPGEGEVDSGAARQELASYIGYNQNGCCPDDTAYTIQGILLAEIKRLRQERAHLAYLVENYLTVLQKEQEKLSI